MYLEITDTDRFIRICDVLYRIVCTFLLTGFQGVALISPLENIIYGLPIVLNLGVRAVLGVLFQIVAQLVQNVYFAICNDVPIDIRDGWRLL